MDADVQVVLGEGNASLPAGSDFVEVLVVATGQITHVPRDWVDNPVLGAAIEKTVAQKVADGEVKAAKVADPPTERDTHEVIDSFARDAQIDLGNASTKAEKIGVITAALAASSPVVTAEPAAPLNPDVQTVIGESSTDPTIPALMNRDDTASSNETPATGDEEN